MVERAAVRLGFSGVGYIARIHAAAAQAVGARVVAVANHRDESRIAFMERFAVPRGYRDAAEMLTDGGIDGLVVCTPNALHAPDALAGLADGVPVLVEKPMAIDSREAARMHETAERTGVPLMVAHCWRFD